MLVGFFYSGVGGVWGYTKI